AGAAAHAAKVARRLTHRLRRSPPGGAAREQAPAKERALQRAIAMHAAAAEARGFAGRIESWNDLSARSEHAPQQISLQSTQGFARKDVEPHRDQWAIRGIENPMRLRRAYQAIAEIFSRIVDAHHLGVLDVGVVDLAVARLDLPLDVVMVEQA